MAEDTAGKQPNLPAHLRDDLKWKPGQSGNPAGRPKGARARLGDDFIAALLEDFQSGGMEAIKLMRAEKPNEYVRALVAILPKEIEGNLNVSLGEALDALDDDGD